MTKPDIVKDFVRSNYRVPTEAEFDELLGAQSPNTREKYKLIATTEMDTPTAPTLATPPAPPFLGSAAPPAPVPVPVPVPTASSVEHPVEITGFAPTPAPIAFGEGDLEPPVPVPVPAPAPAPAPKKIPILLEAGVEVPLRLRRETGHYLIYERAAQ